MIDPVESIPYECVYTPERATIPPVPSAWGQRFSSLRVLIVTQRKGGPNLGIYIQQLVAASAGTLRTLVLDLSQQPHHVELQHGLAILASLAGETLRYLYMDLKPWNAFSNMPSGSPAHTRQLLEATCVCTGLVVPPIIRCHIPVNPNIAGMEHFSTQAQLTPRPATGEAARQLPQPTAAWFD
jgi:hypothetical protein